MGLLPEIESRASVRSFTDEPVSTEQMDRIIEAGRLAPSAKNRQSWRFIVVDDMEVKSRIRDAAFGQDFIAEAPVVVALCTTNVEYTMPNGQLSYPIDIAMSAGFMMLQAQHEGLGTCVVTTYREDDVRSILTVPYKMRVVMLLAVGHPRTESMRARRLPVKRIVSRNHW